MTTSAVACKQVRIQSTRVEIFMKTVKEAGFCEKVHAAIKHPHSAEAKRLWGRLSQCIRITGASVPGSPEQRSSALSQMYALTLAFGTPSLFVTLSPDDTNHSLVLRFHRTLRCTTTS